MVTVTIKGDGLDFNYTTNVRKAGQIITFLGTDESNEEVATPQADIVNLTELLPVSIKNKTPRQVLMESKAKTNPQKVVVLGHYYCELHNVASFPIAELKALFGKIGESVPRNLSRDLRVAVQDNYIYEVNPGEYLVTDLAKELIQKGFSDVQSAKRAFIRATNKKGISQKIVSDEVKKLEVANALERFPNYWDTNLNRGERILWLFLFAEKNNITLLSTADVEYMASCLRDNIPTKSFTALTGTIFKRGYITKSGDKYKILQPGIDYLANKVKKD